MPPTMSLRRAEQLADRIVSLDRLSLIQMLRHMRCGFAMDFPDDYLNAVSIDRLRHIVLAASLHDRDKNEGC